MQSFCKKEREMRFTVHMPWIFLKCHQSYETVSIYLMYNVINRFNKTFFHNYV
jgi:hypothetical protein